MNFRSIFPGFVMCTIAALGGMAVREERCHQQVMDVKEHRDILLKEHKTKIRDQEIEIESLEQSVESLQYDLDNK